MDGETVESDAILNIRYGRHLGKDDDLDELGDHIEDLIEDAGEVRGAREDDGWMNEVLLYDIARVDYWTKRIATLLRRKKAPSATIIEVVLRFRAEKVLRRVGIQAEE